MRRISPEKLYLFLKRERCKSLVLFMAVLVLICVFDVKTGYFSVIGLPYQLLGALAVFGISTSEVLDKKWVHKISNKTFSIYLIHMPVVSVFKKRYNLNAVIQLFSPLIVMCVSIAALEIGYLIANRIHIYNMYSIITGLRIERNIKEK